eukprot:SAG31_NODE_354_length_17223_cov_18.708771_8_plen_115_part_00
MRHRSPSPSPLLRRLSSVAEAAAGAAAGAAAEHLALRAEVRRLRAAAAVEPTASSGCDSEVAAAEAHAAAAEARAEAAQAEVEAVKAQAQQQLRGGLLLVVASFVVGVAVGAAW